MNILLTGSSGFIAHHFKKLNKNHIIKEVSLQKTKIDEIDFTDIDIVLHLSALVHQIKNPPTKEEYFEVNTKLTIDLAKKAKQSGVEHFVFMSTISVYGQYENRILSENSKCFPINLYGKSKFEAEKLLKKIESKNFIVSTIRSPGVYGEKVKGNILRLVKLVDKSFFLPFGKIQNIRSIVYINNLIDLINIIIEKKAEFLSLEIKNQFQQPNL